MPTAAISTISRHRCGRHHRAGGLLAQFPILLLLELVLHASDRQLGQFGDLFHEIDGAHHQPHLGVFVILAGVIAHPHEAFQLKRFLLGIGDGQIIRRPGDAGGEVADLDGRLAVGVALHVPVQGLRLVVREGGVQHLQAGLRLAEFQFYRSRVDQGVGPGELQGVDALLESHHPAFPYQSQILGVVDGQLHRAPLGDGGELDVAGYCQQRQQRQNEQARQTGNPVMGHGAHHSLFRVSRKV
ncbi:MAG: hypothetical protein MZV65_36735 [Chromatiales bacterium]|nr:hypothetical protein [Chromatiales bacterium]